LKEDRLNNLFKRRADWIWVKGSVNKQEYILNTKPNDISSYVNSYVHFRREINLEDSFAAEPFFISADGRYKLYVNGELAGRGPARCHPQKQYVDRYDINPFLKEGRNIIAVLVHTYGKDMSWYEMPVGLQLAFFGCGSLFCQGSVETGGEKLLLDAGADWRYRKSEAWIKDVPSGGTGYTEYYDFNESLHGWEFSDFDDAGWTSSEVLYFPFPLGGSDIVPFPCLVERDIPFLEERLVFPDVLVRMAETKEIPDKNASIQVRREELETLTSCLIEENGGTLEVLTSEGRAVVLLYDFGRIVSGRIDLEVVSPENAVIDIAYGERLTEQGSLFLPPDVPGISIAQVHRIRFKEGINHFQQFEMAGFRYLKLTVRNCPDKLFLKYAGVMSCCYPSTQKGSFSCSDPILEKVWKAGDYTVRMCSLDSFMDCPTREQRQWIGDVFVESQVNLVTEKDTRLIRKYLRQVAETQKPDGMVMMATTCDLNSAKAVFISDFAIQWILTAEKYLKFTGDLETIKSIFQSMVRLIKWFQFYIDENELLCNLPGWTFIDWSMELGRKGAVAVENAFWVGALNAVSDFAGQLGYTAVAEEYQTLSDSTKKAINETFWEEERGVYVDVFEDGHRGEVVSQHANAAVIYFNIAPEQRWAGIFNNILDEDHVKLTRAWRWDKERPFNPSEDIIMTQPFFSIFLQGALANAKMINPLLKNIKTKWGPMVEQSQTLWESWKLTEITSSCHGFSSSPTYFLSTLILGVTPLENGFKRFRVQIPECEIKWAKGAFPTPFGMILVEWERTDQKIITSVDVPEGMEGEIIFPVGFDSMPRSLGSGSHSFSVGKKL
jgi:alpha-L-rhamnosidase